MKTVTYYLHGTNGDFNEAKKSLFEGITGLPCYGRTYHKESVSEYIKVAEFDITLLQKDFNVILIGKSLGGLVAAIIGSKLSIPQILINPLLSKKSIKITDEEIINVFGQKYLDELKNTVITVPKYDNNSIAIATKDDRLIDHEVARKELSREFILVDNGGHSFKNITDCSKQINQFIAKYTKKKAGFTK